MKVRDIIKAEGYKFIHEFCLDRGYTVNEILKERRYMGIRNNLIKILDEKGYTQDLIAELIGKKRWTVNQILKGAK